MENDCKIFALAVISMMWICRCVYSCVTINILLCAKMIADLNSPGPGSREIKFRFSDWAISSMHPVGVDSGRERRGGGETKEQWLGDKIVNKMNLNLIPCFIISCVVTLSHSTRDKKQDGTKYLHTWHRSVSDTCVNILCIRMNTAHTDT